MQMVNSIKIKVNSSTCSEMGLDLLNGLNIPISYLNEKELYNRICTAVILNNGSANAAFRRTNDLGVYLLFDICDIKSLDILEMEVIIDKKIYTVFHDLFTDKYEYRTEIGNLIITPEQIEKFREFGAKPKSAADVFFYNGYVMTNLMMRINEKAYPNNHILAMAG